MNQEPSEQEIQEALGAIESEGSPSGWMHDILDRALRAERERSKRIEAMALKLDCDCAGEYDREALPPTCYRCQILKALRSGVREGA